ncbi:sulfatase [Alteromonas macleodii]|uniref:sulfatase family protein n=1 Tax=Alteromonas TaxID=226 RepID=UPI0010FFB8E0|nr:MULTISPECIES: sulfatase-like hydrolase/transferase [Alteromonas]USI26439.1 sulfatase-like hydrolase/transferase [Alteromonas macleodii]GEA01548.1 N-acetylgalactosamine-6-sulfatase [Alteromonas sp. KUL17]
MSNTENVGCNETDRGPWLFLSLVVFILGMFWQQATASEKRAYESVRAGSDTPPNIIVILADDLGYNDVGYTGVTDIQTPNIDALAAEGVQFTNGYVTHPYCGPSRAGLLAGIYQARFGMENNVSYFPQDKNMGLPLSVKTFPERLQEVGYRTAIFGKWHLGGAPHFQPNKRGFDYFYGFLDGGHNYMPGQVTVGGDGYSLPIMRNTQVAEFEEYLTTALSREASDFIEENRKSPFFIFMSYNAPHTPLQAPEDTIKKYAHIEDTERRVYAAMVDEMDSGIGMIIDALDRQGLRENTLILFLSDNGGVYPEDWQPTSDWADNTPFRRGKVSLLEGGIHVPFLANWKGKIAPGQVFDGLVSSLDIAATSTVLANANTADLEGVNLMPYLTGEKTGSPHKALFWRLEEAQHIWAVRTEDYKYMNQPLPGVGRSFFDMRHDPTESNNIVDSNIEAQQSLARKWNIWNKKNQNNVLQQSWEYKAEVDKFFEALHQRNLTEAKNREVYVIE